MYLGVNSKKSLVSTRVTSNSFSKDIAANVPAYPPPITTSRACCCPLGVRRLCNRRGECGMRVAATCAYLEITHRVSKVKQLLESAKEDNKCNQIQLPNEAPQSLPKCRWTLNRPRVNTNFYFCSIRHDWLQSPRFNRPQFRCKIMLTPSVAKAPCAEMRAQCGVGADQTKVKNNRRKNGVFRCARKHRNVLSAKNRGKLRVRWALMPRDHLANIQTPVSCCDVVMLCTNPAGTVQNAN